MKKLLIAAALWPLIASAQTGSIYVDEDHTNHKITNLTEILFTNIAAPTTPATGKAHVYVDSTAKNIFMKNDAGALTHGIKSVTNVATQYIHGIDDDGTVHFHTFTGGGGGAPSTDHFVTTQNDTADLPNSFSLGSLTTGLLKNTVTSGVSVPSTAVAKTDYWDTTDFVASGASHAHGLAPDPGSTAGTTRFLREDATWAAPAGSGGTVSNVATTSPISGGPITTTGTISLLVNVDHAFTAAQSITLTDATNNAASTLFTIDHETSGTPAIGLGGTFAFKLQDSTTAHVNAANITAAWSNVTHATDASYIDFQAMTGGSAAASVARIFGSGGLSVNSTTDPGAGIVNANTGFKLANTEWPISSNGIPSRTSAYTYSALAAPAGTIVGTTDTQTLSNKRILPRTNSTASATSWTPNFDSYDEEIQTALAGNVTVNSPTYTSANEGERRILRIKDNGTARTITWNAIFRAGSSIALPTTTTISKTLYCGFMYNNTDSKWDLMAYTDGY